LEKPLPPRLELLKILVDAARRAKITITGGLDDLSACALGGLTITDNLNDKLLHHQEIEELPVFIIVPQKRIYTRNVKISPSTSVKKMFLEIHQLAKKDIWTALTLNGILYSNLVGIDSSPIRRILQVSPLAVGVSGTGPAIAVVSQSENEKMVYNVCKTLGLVIRSNITNRGINDGSNNKI
jgi:shikimate kinase